MKIKLLLSVIFMSIFVSCSNKEYDQKLVEVPNLADNALRNIKELEQTHCYYWDILDFRFNGQYNLYMFGKCDLQTERNIQNLVSKEQDSFFGFCNYVENDLKNPPSGRKECYDDLTKIDAEMTILRNMVLNNGQSPYYTSDLVDYKNGVDAKFKEVQQHIYEFNIKYKDILNSSE